MRFLLHFCFLCVALGTAQAQYSIGHTTLTFNDPGRTGGFGSGGGPGRQIQSEIYYPADVDGEDVPFSAGAFPVVVFGHGFAMTWDAYTNIWETFVPEGYILVFPRTEGGLFPAPSHGDFGLDLALIVTKMQDLNGVGGQLFENHVSDKSSIAGHSMGGGATILAAANNANITTIVGLAPAETTPSAISAATSVTVPALIFSADEDLVTPSADHHLPIYNGLSSACKYFVNILGGGHCYYANPNFNCDFGEGSSGGNISITRSEQQEILYRYMLPWLDLYLKGDCAKTSVFENDLLLDPDVSYLESCTSFPSPIFDTGVNVNVNTLSAVQGGTVYQWIDCANSNPISGANAQDFTPSASGSYAVILGSGICADTSACYSLQVNGLPEPGGADVLIFPNPASNYLHVPDVHGARIEILSTEGQTVATFTQVNAAETLYFDLANGFYFVRIHHAEGTSLARMVVRK